MPNPIPSLRRDDFSLVFESFGTKFLFEDLVRRYYIGWESVACQRGPRVRVFHSKRAIRQLEEEGLKRTVEQTREVIAELEKLAESLGKEWGAYADREKLSKEDAKGFFSYIHLFRQYAYFEPVSWEKCFASPEAAVQENFSLAQGYKNIFREKLNVLFFGPQSFFEQFVLALGRSLGISADTVAWYREEEIMEAFAGRFVANEVLAARKFSYVYYIDPELKVYDLYGQEAAAFTERFDPEFEGAGIQELKGIIAHGKGRRVQGMAYVLTRDYGDEEAMRRRMKEMPKGAILVTETTDPSMMEAFYKAGAVVTNLGGLLSHAAITSRELELPCIIGTQVATRVLKTGDMIEVDAGAGIVRILKKA